MCTMAGSAPFRRIAYAEQSDKTPVQRAVMAARIQTGAIIFAALIEGVALFAVVISFLIQGKF